MNANAECVIVCQGFARGLPCEWIGQYLEWYRPNGDINEPLAQWTPDLSKAKRFASLTDAVNEWRAERTVKDPGGGRTIPDGKPNRPLTAFNVSFENTSLTVKPTSRH